MLILKFSATLRNSLCCIMEIYAYRWRKYDACTVMYYHVIFTVQMKNCLHIVSSVIIQNKKFTKM
jgi:hypothetical protein